MKRNRLSLIAATMLVLTGAGAQAQQVGQPSYDELRQQLQALQDRVNALEASSAARPTPAEVGAAKEAVGADVARKAALSAVSVTYDKGLNFRSGDGNFSLRPTMSTQFRYVANVGEKSESNNEAGFEIRRLRPRIQGNVLSPSLTYDFHFDVDRNSGTVSILDAAAQYRFAPEWAVRFGQFKESVFHENDIADVWQVAVERSLVHALLGGGVTDRVQGAALIYGGTKNNPFRAEFAFTDGANSKSTDFRDQAASAAVLGIGPVGAGKVGYGAGARAEYKFEGDWADHRDFTAKGTKSDLFVLGAGADYTEIGDNAILRSTADAQWENTKGWGAYAALHGNFVDVDNGTIPAGHPDSYRLDWGALGQVSYLLAPQWEVFGRYDVVVLDDDFVAGDDTFHEVTAGVNYYLGQNGSYLHNAKLTVDAVYLPNGAPVNQTGLGILAGDEDQFVLRVQFTLTL